MLGWMRGGRYLYDLFAEHFQFYLPKFGFEHGRAEMAQLSSRVAATLSNSMQDRDSFCFIEVQDAVALEGHYIIETVFISRFEGGKTPSGPFAAFTGFKGN
jgi:hypothetical protein